MITNEQLKEWRKLADKSSGGEWTIIVSDGITGLDRAFIAASREAVPALLDEVARLQADKLRIQAILLDLIKTIDASPYGEDGLHHHTCPAPYHGKCTCGAYEAINLARPVEYEE